MTIDNIVIPGGMLAARDGPLNSDRVDETGPESFNITDVARERARSLSVSFVGFRQTREDSSGVPRDIILSTSRSQGSLRRHSSNRGLGRRLKRSQKSSTINVGELGRPGAINQSTSVNQHGRTSDFMVDQSKRTATGDGIRFDAISELSSTYVFQSLGDQHADRNAPDASHLPQVFLDRNNPNHVAPTHEDGEISTQKQERNQSQTSQISTSNIIRRASVAVQNAVETAKDTVTDALRRGSLDELYEKARVRQLQLMRSTAVQYGFQYTFYLILLAVIYFVFIGFPLWNGFVLTIYYIFDMKLVVPAGTAAFLGTGFL